MTGLYLLVLVGIAALFIAASRESMAIHSNRRINSGRGE